MLNMFFPFLSWLKKYSMTHFKADALSGLTVALVLIPQSMAYAQLAGLPPYYGLYASFLPPMLAALFGSSAQLATGPVAVVSLMTSASLAPLATTGSEGFIAYAILLALMVGIFQFSLGLLRLGLVVNFLSHPVVNGFTNAAAIIIATSQLEKMFGVYVDTATHHYETIWAVIQAAFYHTHWPTFIMGVAAFAIMYGLKTIAPKIPNVLVAVVLTTTVAWAIGFEHNETVTLEEIRSQHVREMVMQFNAALEELPALGARRTELSNALDQAKKEGDPVMVLDIEHDISVVEFQTQRLKSESARLRKELRAVLMGAVAQAGGGLVFYPRPELPSGAGTDGRTWRIKIGNKPLAAEKLIMEGGGAVVGVVPKGLPAFSIPKIDFVVMLRLFPYAAIISLLGFMEAISIAKAMAAKTGQRLDPNQELIGQGIANMIGSVGKGYPVSGSFSRSAVNLQAGALTGLSSVFTSLAVLILLLFFTPLLYHLPQAVLAAVIMMAVIGLINVSGFIHAWKAQWYDGLISILSFIATLVFAPHLDKGIMIGVALSLGVFLYKSMRPTVATLSRAEDDAMRCSVTHGLKQCRYIDMVRFDGPLFFANASHLEDQINLRMQSNPGLRHIHIVANGINDIDASGEECLSLLVDRIRSAGLDITFSGVNEAVMRVLKRTHMLEKIGANHIYPTMEKAICVIHEQTHLDASEDDCPLTTACQLIGPAYEGGKVCH
jgi:MFS superfamily sulfate permease-like transporter